MEIPDCLETSIFIFLEYRKKVQISQILHLQPQTRVVPALPTAIAAKTLVGVKRHQNREREVFSYL